MWIAPGDRNLKTGTPQFYTGVPNSDHLFTEVLCLGDDIPLGNLTPAKEIFAFFRKEVDGPFVSILHGNLDKITEMILGKSGTLVHFQFLSSRAKNPAAPQIISLVREEVQLTEDAAQAQIVEMDLPGDVQKLGWLTVPSFYGDPDKLAPIVKESDPQASSQSAGPDTARQLFSDSPSPPLGLSDFDDPPGKRSDQTRNAEHTFGPY